MTDFSAATVNARIRQLVIEVINTAPGVNAKDKIRSAAKLLGLPFDRARKYKYGAVQRIDAHEADQIRHHHKEARLRHIQRLAYEYRTLRTAFVVDAALAGDETVGALLPPPLADNLGE